LNKILKDIICRFQISQGKRVHYVPGWDCHGLPIEIKALQTLQAHHDTLEPPDIRKAARSLAEKTVEEQKKGFKEWAVMGDWDGSWRTMDKSYILRQLHVFKCLVERGLITLELKPVYWSPSSGTALAEAELEYDENHKSTAAFVRCPIVRMPDTIQHEYKLDLKNLGLLIWTTTPWTLPANMAIAVHKDLEYCIVALRNEPNCQMIVAKARLEYLRSVLGADTPIEIIMDGLLGFDLMGSTMYRNPCGTSEPKRVIHADFVSPESGSGLVHLAPGHGMEDYNVCQPLGVPAFAPVDDNGRFTSNTLPNEDATRLTGRNVLTDGSRVVLDLIHSLERRDPGFGKRVLVEHQVTHKYPIDWRTKEPIIIRATKQWFADVDSIKSDALESLNNIEYIPESSKTRLESFTKSRSQWCISRQRSWGVPIPALYRVGKNVREAVMDSEVVGHILTEIEKRGVDAWFTDAKDERSWIPNWLPPNRYERGKDTMDVWFDSGTSWTLLPPRPDKTVADVYVEGTDQHRGWFQSSLLTHVAYQQARREHSPKAPFNTLITHGFTLDQDGRKMSKSLGNVISPEQIVDGTLLPPMKSRKQRGTADGIKSMNPVYDSLGPDALRLWVASSDYTRDVIIGQPVLQSVHQALHKYRVTFKWLLGALADYDASSISVTQVNSNNPHELIDKIARYQLDNISQEVHRYFVQYEIFKAINAINRYINLDLSAFYFETLKDRLYTGSKIERIPAQKVLCHVFHELLLMLGPVTPLLVEEVWEHTPDQIKNSTEHPLRRIWNPAAKKRDGEKKEQKDLETKLRYIQKTNEAIKAVQETLREKKLIGSGLESEVHIFVSSKSRDILASLFHDNMSAQLAAIFVVSKVFIHTDGSAGKEKFLEGKDSRSVDTVADASFELDDVNVGLVVTRPLSGKCARCWRYLAPEKNGLCRRCDDVVRDEWSEMYET
jgi:isoleucyl-tRNA synthetase